MTWYTLDPPSTAWDESDSVSTTWRGLVGINTNWTGDDLVGELLYGFGGIALFGSGGEILRGKND